MGAAEALRRSAAETWDAQHRHPFVTGIGDGTLDIARFSTWVRQDYLFLVEYSRLLAAGAARAPDVETMACFADLTRTILHEEMSFHRDFAAEFGISPAQLEAETMLPTTQGYTDFLVRTAAHGDFSELVAALLPCMWGYCEVGERLAERERPGDERLAKWIDMYSSPEFAELASWCRALTDRVAEGAGPASRALMERAFLTSSRYELAFWEMAWSGEEWSVA